ncbi:flavodoxin family protein [candidate division WOR-3 bacterium]|nr:flavodoxin family protein [candidate division WOR-3 bacterium]
MNVLGISGTPRENGNSDILLEYSLQPFTKSGWSVRHLRLREMTIHPCRACDGCKECKGNPCIQSDDMHLIYDAWRWCDALIISTPVYSRNISAQMMAVLDRHYGIREDRSLAGKPGGAIAVGAGTAGGQSIAITAIYNWMLSCGMICVPGELNGVTAKTLDPGDILKQPDRLRQAEVLGRNVMAIATKLRS